MGRLETLMQADEANVTMITMLEEENQTLHTKVKMLESQLQAANTRVTVADNRLDEASRQYADLQCLRDLDKDHYELVCKQKVAKALKTEKERFGYEVSELCMTLRIGDYHSAKNRVNRLMERYPK